MLLQRERPRAPSARLLMPAPAPLPNLREALARRAEVFAFDDAEAETPPRGFLARLGAMLRGLADLLEPSRRAGAGA